MKPQGNIKVKGRKKFMNHITNDNGVHYYDRDFNEVNEGDQLMMDGKVRKIYRTNKGTMGWDATNPRWIEKGWAGILEFGIYVLTESDLQTAYLVR